MKTRIKNRSMQNHIIEQQQQQKKKMDAFIKYMTTMAAQYAPLNTDLVVALLGNQDDAQRVMMNAVLHAVEREAFARNIRGDMCGMPTEALQALAKDTLCDPLVRAELERRAKSLENCEKVCAAIRGARTFAFAYRAFRNLHATEDGSVPDTKSVLVRWLVGNSIPPLHTGAHVVIMRETGCLVDVLLERGTDEELVNNMMECTDHVSFSKDAMPPAVLHRFTERTTACIQSKCKALVGDRGIDDWRHVLYVASCPLMTRMGSAARLMCSFMTELSAAIKRCAMPDDTGRNDALAFYCDIVAAMVFTGDGIIKTSSRQDGWDDLEQAVSMVQRIILERVDAIISAVCDWDAEVDADVKSRLHTVW